VYADQRLGKAPWPRQMTGMPADLDAATRFNCAVLAEQNQ